MHKKRNKFKKKKLRKEIRNILKNQHCIKKRKTKNSQNLLKKNLFKKNLKFLHKKRKRIKKKIIIISIFVQEKKKIEVWMNNCPSLNPLSKFTVVENHSKKSHFTTLRIKHLQCPKYLNFRAKNM